MNKFLEDCKKLAKKRKEAQYEKFLKTKKETLSIMANGAVKEKVKGRVWTRRK